MKVFLEAGSGFKAGRDVYGNEIVGSADSTLAIQKCAQVLESQQTGRESIEIVQTSDASSILESAGNKDLLISLHVNFYRDSAGVGLRGYYRSTRWHNSEKCKAVAITITKAVRDHLDMYYHGVYNEQRDKHPQLEPIIKAPCLAALIEVGLKDEFRDKVTEPAVHANIGTGLARGILRHLQALR